MSPAPKRLPIPDAVDPKRFHSLRRKQLDHGRLRELPIEPNWSVFSPFPENQRKRECFCSGIAKKEGGRSVFAKEEANLV